LLLHGSGLGDPFLPVQFPFGIPSAVGPPGKDSRLFPGPTAAYCTIAIANCKEKFFVGKGKDLVRILCSFPDFLSFLCFLWGEAQEMRQKMKKSPASQKFLHEAGR
jgi:hypothetical protein